MAHPPSSRTSFRYANPLAGGAAGGPAKPAPRRLLEGLRPQRTPVALCAKESL